MYMQGMFVIILIKEQMHINALLWYFETTQILTCFWWVIHPCRFFQIMTLNDTNLRMRTFESLYLNANFRLSTEAHSLFNGGLNGHFEDLSLASRPSELVRQYGDLYNRIRVDALDALDKIGQLDDLSVLKEKILFSVVVVRGSYEIPIATSRTLPADLKKKCYACRKDLPRSCDCDVSFWVEWSQIFKT